MSDDDEDHGRTAKRLEDDFSGADGTPRKRMKMGMTGAMSTEGFRTGGLAGTVWSKEVSVSMQARGYVSMASGGAGNGSIAQLLGPPPTSIAPMSSPQTSGSESVIMPHRSVSESVRLCCQAAEVSTEEDGASPAETGQAHSAFPEKIAAQSRQIAAQTRQEDELDHQSGDSHAACFSVRQCQEAFRRPWQAADPTRARRQQRRGQHNAG